MNPAFLDSMSWEMAEVYGAVNDQILINLAKYFPYFDRNNLPASSFAYQAKMLAQMGKINRETIAIIKRNLTGANAALGNMLEQAIIDAISGTEPELVEAVKKGIFSPAGMPIVAPNQMRAYQLYYQQAAQKLNLVNTVMLESTQSAYQQAVAGVVAEIDLADRLARTQQYLDIAAGETITGVSSWNAAMAHAMERLTTGGITGFIDHAGRRWSAEAYVAMDIRTTVFNTGRAAVWETNQNFGNDLYVVSYHNGARPLCYPWQNKVVSATDNARTVTDLDGNEIQVIAQSATSYGQAAGLFGINCKHHPDPFIPGVSVIHVEPQGKELNDRVYAESQEQRALERKIREQKRDLMIMKEQGYPDDAIKAQRAKIRETDDEIDAFCDKTGRARRQNREGVYTKRDFPDADKYDVAAFERKQKNLIDSFYQNGGEQQGYTFGQMTPNEEQAPIVQAPPQPSVEPLQEAPKFIPAKTIEEAEEYARTNFYNDRAFGAQGVSYAGVSVDTANAVNKRLTEFFDTYNVDKLGGITAPAGNTKLGKKIEGANAAFGTVNRHLMLSRKNLKTPETILKSLKKEKEMVSNYLANPARYKVTPSAKRILDASAVSGRGTVGENIVDVLNHELGHSLEKPLKGVANYSLIESNWKGYAEKISGYATVSFGEYIAESHCAWLKGEPIETELEKGFMALMR